MMEKLKEKMKGVEHFMAKLERGAELAAGWKGLPDEKKEEFLSLSPDYREELWNVIPDDLDVNYRDLVVCGVFPVPTVVRLAQNEVNYVKTVASSCCKEILLIFPMCLSASDGNDAIDILRFFAKYTDADEAMNQSGAALSDENEARSSIVEGTLQADKIHHNMFRGSPDGHLDERKFIRFKFPENDSVLLQLLKLGTPGHRRAMAAGAKVLQVTRSFLSRLVNPDEPTAQARKF